MVDPPVFVFKVDDFARATVKTEPAKPRLLVLTSTFPRWLDDSEPPFVFELSRRLTDAFEVTVLAPRAPGSLRNETMAELCVIRFPYFFRRWESLATYGGGILNRLRANRLSYLLVPLFLAGQLWALVRLLRRESFDVIHAHWIIPQGLVAVVARWLAQRSMPLVCTSHGGDLFALRGRLLQRLKRWVIDRCQVLTVVSSAMQAAVVAMGVDPGKVEVISMGVDLRYRFTPDPGVTRNSHELVFVGRLVEKKGLRVLLEAMPAVLARHPEVRLTVAGSGPLERDLRRQARALGITDRVDFLGMVAQSELPALYRRATLFVAPFRVARSGDQEGLGLVLVEALGCGCPVIASDLPAVREVIVDQRFGLLVDALDSVVLAAAVDRLLADPALRERLGTDGRDHVLRWFDWTTISARYAGLLRNISEGDHASKDCL